MPTKTPEKIDFKQAQEQLRQELKRGMLDAASLLLEQEGAASLTVRRVASAVNCSTTLLYALFGRKNGLSNALYLEGFQRLQAQFDALKLKSAFEQQTPEEQLWLLAYAYQEFARANPSYYMIMFGDAIAGFIPENAARETAWESFQSLSASFELALEERKLTINPTYAARLLWAAMHGVLSLELKAYYLKQAQADALYKNAVRAVLSDIFTGAAIEL